MSETILSAGIDIGTTTTQLIFSRLVMEKSGGYGVAPKVEVVQREVIYRSEIHLTPLTEEDNIDAKQVAALIQKEYENAGIRPEDLTTGAVIITGESARKRNAKEVTLAMAKLAGEFVVATAGPDLESVLAGKGAGADLLSEEEQTAVLNIDIGGGTSNLCLFEDGVQTDCACYDIGGRVVRVDKDGRIERISPKVEELLPMIGVQVKVGDLLTIADAQKIANVLADLLAEAANLKPHSILGEKFITNHGLLSNKKPKIISFSGGVADCMDSDQEADFTYGDLGIFLGKAIRKHPVWNAVCRCNGKETMRATVIGAGNCSMEVSGSTIYTRGAEFPMKNLPVQKLLANDEAKIDEMDKQIMALKEQRTETFDKGYALAIDGPVCPSFSEVECIAEMLAKELAGEERTIPIVVEQDFSKALGQALKRRLPPHMPILCLDGVVCQNGDFIDIGKPVGGGIALPVIVKTLIFSDSRRKDDEIKNNAIGADLSV